MDETELLQAIAASPRDLDLVRRLADLLVEKGDRRGRLLQLELACRDAERRVTALKREFNELLLFGRVDPALLNQVLPFEVVSPLVGTFYAAPNPEAAPFVQVGRQCRPETVVCIIEAMKVFNEIQAEVHGVVAEILVRNGETVDYGRPLFRLHRLPQLLSGG
jgi:biotin carboxyl carrier protein